MEKNTQNPDSSNASLVIIGIVAVLLLLGLVVWGADNLRNSMGYENEAGQATTTVEESAEFQAELDTNDDELDREMNELDAELRAAF